MRTKILVLFLFLSIYMGNACSLYKITIGGRTFVGNNEDWFNPNCQIWFEPKGEGLYGVMNLGFDDQFPQGAINEAGLLFDGFSMPFQEVKNTEGKKKVPESDFTNFIMHNYANVHEVKTYLSKIDLSFLSTAMLVFVDKSGDYLIVEGDELIIGNDEEQSFSNFYPSKCSSRAEVPIPFYQSGLKYITETKAEPTFEYCSSVMEKMTQKITQYTSIYDLHNGIIRLYHYQNFNDYVEIDLQEELRKGFHTIKIPELFSKESEGYNYLNLYNDPVRFSNYLKDEFSEVLKASNSSGQVLTREMEDSMIDHIAFRADIWNKSNKDHLGMIQILKINTDLFPENPKGFNLIGDAFLEGKNKKQAKAYFEKVLSLDVGNEHAMRMIEQINQQKK